jgi:coniferyl-aldehyde dehydrogenase
MVYDEISEVINYINKNDHPLGLYYFGNTKQEQEKVIKNTRSGGVTINDAMFHLMQSQLPFGGVGPSGYGCYHGREGFMNFSNMRSIYYQTNNDSVFGMLRPPKNKSIGKLQNILKKLS